MRRNRTPFKTPSRDQSEYTVEKATQNDVDGIMAVAIAAGKAHKDSEAGFLMDDYEADAAEHTEEFKRAASRSRFFYVIKNREGKVLGFLLAYRKERWLRREPGWMDTVHWRPDFDQSNLEDFVLLEKIAVDAELRGTGLGSVMFSKFRDDANEAGIYDMFSETIIGPRPNFAALAFAIKQKYALAGIRYEEHQGRTITDVVYHRKL
jgi:GNAT superfamily N-acetyltransferase